MKTGDPFIMAQPIYTTTIKGKSYILDGHNRIQAAINNGQALEVLELPFNQAYQKFSLKVNEILKGMH